MDKLLTKKDLAQKLQVTERSIDNWIKDGVLTPCKGIPVIRFSPQYIADIEGIKLEKFSPLEKTKLEKQIEELRRENEKLKNIITKIVVAGSEIFTYKSKA
ncbi:MAG: histidine kinase [Clostridiaceae bacterium]